jgi:citrate lyase beta subunit
VRQQVFRYGFIAIALVDQHALRERRAGRTPQRTLAGGALLHIVVSRLIRAARAAGLFVLENIVTKLNPPEIKTNPLSGLSVALAVVLEAIAFALVFA